MCYEVALRIARVHAAAGGERKRIHQGCTPFGVPHICKYGWHVVCGRATVAHGTFLYERCTTPTNKWTRRAAVRCADIFSCRFLERGRAIVQQRVAGKISPCQVSPRSVPRSWWIFWRKHDNVSRRLQCFSGDLGGHRCCDEQVFFSAASCVTSIFCEKLSENVMSDFSNIVSQDCRNSSEGSWSPSHAPRDPRRLPSRSRVRRCS